MLVFCGDPGFGLHCGSGAAVHLSADVRALRELGHDVETAVLGPIRRLRGLWTEPHEWWAARRLARQALSAARADLVYERYSLFSDAGRVLAQRWGARHVVEVNAPLRLERDRVRFTGWAQRIERKVLGGADRVVVVSEWLRRWVVDEVGVDAARVVCVPPGCDARPGDRARTRARFGLTGLVVGFVGSMRPWHGADAISDLLEVLPEATALVVGDGPLPPQVHPRLVRTGWVPAAEVADLVAAMDVALVPGQAPRWASPLKWADYRAQGVPISVRGDRDLAGWADAVRGAAALPRAPQPRLWTDVLREAIEPEPAS